VDEAWEANPLVFGTADPNDYQRVVEAKEFPANLKVVVELQVDVDDPDDTVPERRP
jgi:hypothetical protein